MSRPPTPRKLRLPYWVTMVLTALVLGGTTVVFVLVVLPQRFVLQGDLRASGVTFPTGSVPFQSGDVAMRPPRGVPATPPPQVSDSTVQAGQAAPPVERRAPADSTAAVDGLGDLASVDAAAAPERGEADGEIVPLPTEVVPTDPLDEARTALAEGRLEEARARYLEAVGINPDDPDLLLEWADVLQFRLEDFEAALTTLHLRAAIATPSPDDRYRLAQLSVWTGSEAAARSELRALLVDEPAHAAAWSLLGDLLRWEGRRTEAADAYGRALDLAPGDSAALDGRALLREDTQRAAREVDGRRMTSTVSWMRDSDGFRRSEARAYGSLFPFPEVVELTVGLRRLEGFDLSGHSANDEGGFVEATMARWAREGSLRFAATLGAERSALKGTEAVLGASVQARDLRGWNLGAGYRSAPGHTLASTFESLAAGVRAERLALDAYRGLPAGFEMSAALEGVRLRGGGDDVDRFGAGVAITRVVGGWFRTGVSSRYLRYDAPSPVVAGRRLFWDPSSYWSTGTLIELRSPADPRGISAYIRATPGIALARERDSIGSVWVGQVESEAGFRMRVGNVSVGLDAFYARGRAGEYTSRGLSLGVEVPR